MDSATVVRRENVLSFAKDMIMKNPFAFADIRHQDDKEYLIASIPNGNKTAEFMMQRYDEGFVIHTMPMGGVFAPEVRPHVALNLMAINNNLRRGQFVVDPADGTLSFRNFIPCYEGMSLTESCIWNEMSLGVRMLSNYMSDILRDIPEDKEDEFVIKAGGEC